MARPRAVVVAIVIAAASFSGWWFGRNGPGTPSNPNAATGSRFAARVTETVDGDTVHVQTTRGADVVRLLGVNTPTRP